MNRKLLLLLALLLFSYGLSSCSSDDNSPSEGEQTDTPELFTKRYNPDQSFYSKILGQEIKYSVLLPQEYLSESTWLGREPKFMGTFRSEYSKHS